MSADNVRHTSDDVTMQARELPAVHDVIGYCRQRVSGVQGEVRSPVAKLRHPADSGHQNKLNLTFFFIIYLYCYSLTT